MQVTAYVVLIPLEAAAARPAEVLAVKLTREAAEALARQVPGSWIEKHVANKSNHAAPPRRRSSTWP